MQNKRLRVVIAGHPFAFYAFKPSLFHYFLPGYRKLNCKAFLRMTAAYLLEGYIAYYMVKENQILGCAVVSHGGGRMKCSNRRDIVIGPYWIESQFRGNGYAKTLIQTVLHEMELQYDNVYAFVQKSNYASLKTLEANAFQILGDADIAKFTHRWILRPGGDSIILKYRGSMDTERK